VVVNEHRRLPTIVGAVEGVLTIIRQLALGTVAEFYPAWALACQQSAKSDANTAIRRPARLLR
jgi:hypothetical protein